MVASSMALTRRERERIELGMAMCGVVKDAACLKDDAWGLEDAACLKDDEANALCNKVDLHYGEDTLRTKAPDYRNSFRLLMVLTRRRL